MKKILLLILAMLLLAGCAFDAEVTTVPPAEPGPTEPPLPWVQAVGEQWDAEGILLEIPLNVPDGRKYSASMAFDGDLLLWTVDNHLAGISTLELCLVELDDGTVAAQAEIDLSEYVFPQSLGDDLYLCDRTAGRILRLDKNLKTTKTWEVEPQPGSWYMGEGEILYQLDEADHLTSRDLSTGEITHIPGEETTLSWLSCSDGYATMEYYREDTGAKTAAVLDLVTGELRHPDFDDSLTDVTYLNGDWLCGKYMDGYIFYLSADGGPTMRIPRQDDHIKLLPEGYLTRYGDESMIYLYDLQGKLVSCANVFETGGGFAKEELIWNESLGGYFFFAGSYDHPNRLLFWDISRSAGGDDLALQEVPAEDEALTQLKQRARDIGEKYGLTVLVGDDCDTEFDEFSAGQVTDWDTVTTALDTLEEALAVYPEGFIRQLRYSNIRGIQIQLVCDLWADGSGRYGDGYAAFTQPQWDHYLMVLDIDDTTTQTYYHEFSHIIDACLEWDAGERQDALYSEERWDDLNPDWFTGYSYDYSIEHDLWDATSFIDGYSTIKPTEDRARVMEYAMAGYSWAFQDAPELEGKLDYYCKCIRDAFDTTGWPETTLWEAALNNE